MKKIYAIRRSLILLISIIVCAKLMLGCSKTESFTPKSATEEGTWFHPIKQLKKDYNITKEDLIIDSWTKNKVDTNQLIINGKYNDRLWLGGYDRTTKKQLLEWIEKEELKTSFTVHKGYGEYLDINIDRFFLKEPIYSNKNLYFILEGQDQNFRITDLYFIKDNQLLAKKEGNSGPGTLFYEAIYPWYNGIMVKARNEIICFDEDGDSIYTVDTRWSNLKDHEPISMQEGILKTVKYDTHYKNDVTCFAFERHNLKTEEIVWEKSIEAPQSMSSKHRLEKEYIEKNGGLWSYTHHYVLLNGEKFTVTIKVDIETGELSFAE